MKILDASQYDVLVLTLQVDDFEIICVLIYPDESVEVLFLLTLQHVGISEKQIVLSSISMLGFEETRSRVLR